MEEVNCEPLSVVMTSGTPCWAIHPWFRASMTVSAAMSLIGKAAGHLEWRSTTVNRCEKPFDAGIVTKSACMCEKRFAGTMKSPIGVTVWR